MTRIRARANKDKSLQDVLARNNHSMVVMDTSEFIDFSVIQKKRSGIDDRAVISWIEEILAGAGELTGNKKRIWDQQKSKIKTYGAYLPVFSDAKTLAFLAAEMKRSGKILGKYRINLYNGKAYVILEGYAGLRKQLTGTRYLANNPKVVSMAIGKLGASRSIKGGIVVSIIFSVAFHSLDQLINDRATWHDFVAGVSIDIVTAAVSGAVAWNIVSAMIGGAAMAAVGPIAIVVISGAFLAAFGNALSERYDLTNRLAQLLKEAEARLLKTWDDAAREWKQGLSYADEDPVGFMQRLFGIPYYGISR